MQVPVLLSSGSSKFLLDAFIASNYYAVKYKSI